VKKPDTILDEVHAIRRQIDEATKDMSSLERTAYFNKRGEESARKYGFRLVKSARSTTSIQDK